MAPPPTFYADHAPQEGYSEASHPSYSDGTYVGLPDLELTPSTVQVHPPLPADAGPFPRVDECAMQMPNTDCGEAAMFLGTALEMDPSYRSPTGLYDQLTPDPPKIPVWTTRTLIGPHTPTPVTIPSASSDAKTFPLFQFYRPDPHEEQTIARPSHEPLLFLGLNPALQQGAAPNDANTAHTAQRSDVQDASPFADILQAGRLEAQIQRKQIPCFECCFARVSGAECEGLPGKPCTRCTRLAFELPNSMKGVEGSASFIENILFFDIWSTQKVLSELRGEAQRVLDLSPDINPEDFLVNDSIICHISSSNKIDASLDKDGVQVVIERLATTQKAASQTASSNLEFPEPGLNALQMDRLIKITHRMRRLGSLTKSEKDIIAAALKVCDHVGVLFNWDANRMCFDDSTRNIINGDPWTASQVLAKNVVLETVYSFVHRVQDLMKMICFNVHRSLTQPLDPKHDPATISCAPWIIYGSLKCFKKLVWQNTNLQYLKKFLNQMHERASAAISAVERYRRHFAHARCGMVSPNQDAFRQLVTAKKAPQKAMAFAYERYNEARHQFTPPAYLSERSYTYTLECRIPNANFLGRFRHIAGVKDRCEVETTGSKITLAELKERDGDLNRRPSSEYGSQTADGGSGSQIADVIQDSIEAHQLETPSLSRNETTLDSSYSLDWDHSTGPPWNPLDLDFDQMCSALYDPTPILEDPDRPEDSLRHRDWIPRGMKSPSEELEPTQKPNLDVPVAGRRKRNSSDASVWTKRRCETEGGEDLVEYVNPVIPAWDEAEYAWMDEESALLLLSQDENIFSGGSPRDV